MVEMRLLSARKRLFAAECAVDMDVMRAAKAVGYSRCKPWEYWNAESMVNVRPMVEDRLLRLEAVCEPNALFVRDYLHDVLTFCPTDYFTLAPDGTWCIDPVSFRDVPDRVRRLVQKVETRWQRGQLVVSVEFISKSAALAIAARLALLDKDLGRKQVQLPWDSMARAPNTAAQDKLKELESRAS